tara:strand:- start:2744 stop:4477 length:1734 start_codon:yes stop_codon:yes gene_type:complete
MKENFNKIFFIFGKKHINKIFFFIIFLIIISFVELISLGLIPLYVSSLLEPDLIFEKIRFLNFINSTDASKNLFITIGILLIIVFLVKNFFIGLFTYLFNIFLKNLNLQITTSLYSYYLNSELKTLKKYNSNFLIRNIINETSLTVEYLRLFVYLIKETLVLIAIFFLLIYVNLKTTLIISTIFLIILFVFFKVFRKKLNQIGAETQLIRGKQLKLISETFGSIFDIKIFSSEKIFENNYKKLANSRLHLEFIGNLIASIPKILFEILLVSSIVLLTIYFISIDFNRPETFTLLSLIAVVSIRFLPIFNLITTSIARMKSIHVSLDLIKNEIEKLKRLTKIKDTNKETISFNNEIEVNIPQFEYDNSKINILNINDLKIKKGDAVGIYGESGSGKSTFLNIFSGLYLLDIGYVKVDNIDIKKNIVSWQKKIGYVSQSIFLIDDTIKKNIIFNKNINQVDDDKINNLLRFLNLYKFINSLPHGINTNVGQMGSNLSAGQKQRLGIARALYDDPDILILDEATSNLDEETEKDILQRLFDPKFKKNKTFILISHKKENLLNCNKIFNLEKGKLINEKDK